MYRHILRDIHSVRSISLDRRQVVSFQSTPAFVRSLGLDAKYTEKLWQRAQEAGLSVEALKERAKKVTEKQKEKDRQALEATLPARKVEQSPATKTSKVTKERKDGCPVKPLTDIFNIERLLSTPHTAAQINALWTAYHAASSGGTGRGFVCASVPLDLHKQMESIAQKYPTFVVPLPRPRPLDAGPLQPGESDTAYEFYFMQWVFHDKPPVPSADESNAFDISSSTSSTNPPVATVLFTPLQEYKLRQAFSTPYLIATFYTDLATTHGTILMRGEITPSAASATGGPDRYLLSQEDTHLLIMMLQRFYLWDKGENSASKILQTFHEKPEEFKWEELVKASVLTA